MNQMDESKSPVVVEQSFKHAPEVVWEAITSLDLMNQWFFPDIPSFEPEEGFTTSFDVRSGERNFRHQWKIVEVLPCRRIKYHWSYAEYEGEGYVTFELIEKRDGTMLRLVNEGLETFPRDIPEFTRESCEAGWNYFIRQNLKDFLEPDHAST
jgi:uncharacterized protein YndB with AHSA1/START domain